MNGKTYTWQGWSDGGAISHSIQAKGTSTYTAIYATPGGGSGSGSGGGGGAGGTVKAPQTRLGKHPPKKTRSRAAKFIFKAKPAAGAAFFCKLDGKRKARCRSPKTYRKLKPGRHTFKVWARAKGKTDPTPARFGWKILRR